MIGLVPDEKPPGSCGGAKAGVLRGGGVVPGLLEHPPVVLRPVSPTREGYVRLHRTHFKLTCARSSGCCMCPCCVILLNTHRLDAKALKLFETAHVLLKYLCEVHQHQYRIERRKSRKRFATQKHNRSNEQSTTAR